MGAAGSGLRHRITSIRSNPRLPSYALSLYLCAIVIRGLGRSLKGKLDGKVALVTGSGRNIGRATVLQLADEGCHVVVNARSNEQEAESVAREARDRGVKAIPVLADVGKKDQVEALA